MRAITNSMTGNKVPIRIFLANWVESELKNEVIDGNLFYRTWAQITPCSSPPTPKLFPPDLVQLKILARVGYQAAAFRTGKSVENWTVARHRGLPSSPGV